VTAQPLIPRWPDYVDSHVKVMSGVIGKGLKYAKLIGKVDGDGFPYPPSAVNVSLDQARPSAF